MTKPSSRGGRRPGAGRPKQSGSYGEPTTPVRIPNSLLPLVKDILAQKLMQNQTPQAKPSGNVDHYWSVPITPPPQALALYTSHVSAGIPSPADDHVDDVLDLHELLIKHPESSYYVRVDGDSMIDAGIHAGDILIVEYTPEARHGQIVIAAVDGELTVKRYYINAGKICLVAENPKYDPIEIGANTRFQLWGVVTGLVRQFR